MTGSIRIVLKPGLSDEQLRNIEDHVKRAGAGPVLIEGKERSVVAVIGAAKLEMRLFETLPGVLSHVKSEQRRVRASAARPDASVLTIDHELSQLNQFLGQAKYQPAGAVLPEFIPARWWQQLLHNQSSLLLKGSLLFKKYVVVVSVPYHLEH